MRDLEDVGEEYYLCEGEGRGACSYVEGSRGGGGLGIGRCGVGGGYGKGRGGN